MKSVASRFLLGVVLASGLVGSAAAEDPKALPTLLIKGEVVSMDSSDPAAPLLKVKDRYGFETPIFLTGDTKISQGESALTISNLSAGTPVEVEYNFDVNTAKRHAVTVKLPAAPAAADAAPVADAAALAIEAASAEAPEAAGIIEPAAPAAPDAPSPVDPAAPAAP